MSAISIDNADDTECKTNSSAALVSTITDPSARIKQYLHDKKSLRFANIEGISFLRYCIAMIDEDLAIEIIKHGIDLDINEPWDNGQTPLHFACQMDMPELLKAMLRHRANELDLYAISDDFLVQFNDFQCGGKTALHYAAMNGCSAICEILIDYERNTLQNDKLLGMQDFEGNDTIEIAVMYTKMKTAKYLLSLLKNSHAKMDVTLQQTALGKKRLTDSKSTRLRFEQENENLIANANDILNKVFVLPKLWTQQQCTEILQKVIKYGDKTGWTTERHRSYATTDIPSYCIGFAFDEQLRQLLHETLFPCIIEKYALQQRFKVDEAQSEYVEIGVRDLFFVKYDFWKQNQLKLHRDGSIVSFNILFNDSAEFDGGGTYFKHMDKVVEIGRGDCVIHSGKVLHAGHPITRGYRYIVVGFLDAKKRQKKAAV